MNNETKRLSDGMAVIERTYRAIWNDWFEGMGVPRADFCVTHDCADSGYRPKKNELHLSLPDLNVEEAADDIRTLHNIAPLPGIGWPHGGANSFMSFCMNTSIRSWSDKRHQRA